MPTFTIHQAKTQLSELIRRAEAGEEVIIARGSEPVAQLKPIAAEALSARRLAGRGMLSGKAPPIPDAALIGPLSDDELREAFGDAFDDQPSGS